MACSQPWERGFIRYMPSPFHPASVVIFQLHGGVVSLMQALATLEKILKLIIINFKLKNHTNLSFFVGLQKGTSSA